MDLNDLQRVSHSLVVNSFKSTLRISITYRHSYPLIMLEVWWHKPIIKRLSLPRAQW